MAVNVAYNHTKPYTGARQQPLAHLLVIGPSGSISINQALVDSGADLIQVPQSIGVTAGLLVPGAPLPPGGSLIPISTAGGVVNMVRLPGVSLEIEGIAITADVLFHPSGASRALIGRNGIIALGNVGFDVSRWLWG